MSNETITDDQFYEICRAYAGACALFLKARKCEHGIRFNAGDVTIYAQICKPQQLTESLQAALLESARALASLAELEKHPKLAVSKPAEPKTKKSSAAITIKRGKGCALAKFQINGKDVGYYPDFGKVKDLHPYSELASKGGCSYAAFIPAKCTTEILEKYGITHADHKRIIAKLKKVLEIGQCTECHTK